MLCVLILVLIYKVPDNSYIFCPTFILAYAVMVSTWSILVGTIPSGRATFANWVSILLGFIMMLFHVVFTSEFTINKTGRFDIFTEIYLRCTRDKEFLLKLKADTKKAFETGAPVQLVEEEEAEKMIDGDGTFDKNDQPMSGSDSSSKEGKQEQAVVAEEDVAVVEDSSTPEDVQQLPEDVTSAFDGKDVMA